LFSNSDRLLGIGRTDGWIMAQSFVLVSNRLAFATSSQDKNKRDFITLLFNGRTGIHPNILALVRSQTRSLPTPFPINHPSSLPMISAPKEDRKTWPRHKKNRARPSGDQRPAAGRAHPPRGPLLAAADRGHAPPAPRSAGPKLLAPRRAPRGPTAGPSSVRLEREIEGEGEEGEKGRPDAEAHTPSPRARRRRTWTR